MIDRRTYEVEYKVHCPVCCGTVDLLEGKDVWIQSVLKYKKLGKFKCRACHHTFKETYGVKE